MKLREEKEREKKISMALALESPFKAELKTSELYNFHPKLVRRRRKPSEGAAAL